MTSTDQYIATIDSFLMKDIFDIGYACVTDNKPTYARNVLDLLDGYNILEGNTVEDDHPRYDYYIWTALARIQVTTGDIANGGIEINIKKDDEHEEAVEWTASYVLEDENINTFLKVKRIDEGYPVVPGGLIQFKEMGAVNINELMNKVGSYPMMVHPKLRERSPSVFHYSIINYLMDTGLRVVNHWMPNDTSKGYARYYLTDGFVHYLIDFSAPILLDALDHIDDIIHRDASEGGIDKNDTGETFQTVD